MREIVTIHDKDVGDIRIEKHDNGSVVFLFPKQPGWMYASPTTVQHPEHLVNFGYVYNDPVVSVPRSSDAK